jgi:flagellum-specific peptidoglycan hydrolase FlgJ
MFPDDIVKSAQQAQSHWTTYDEDGLIESTVFASVTLAQWALESSYGKFMPHGSNNPFGIKATDGEAFVVAWTQEFKDGKYIKIPQKFARYASIDQAFDAHAKLLATSGYYVKAQHDNNPEKYATDLTGIYATDPNYGSKLISIIRANTLTQYDLKQEITNG